MLPFSVTILGSSSAFPTIQRFPTAQVVRHSERLYLIDCGEGAQLQMRKFGIKFGRINHIFISHLHGDHIFGLPGLLSTMAMGGKKGEIHLYSHSDLKSMLENFMKFMNEFEDFRVIYHPLNFKKRAVILEDQRITVESFPLKHRIPCCGFLFKEKPHERHLNGALINDLNIPIKDRVALKNGEDYLAPDGTVYPNARLTFPGDPVRSFAFCTDTLYQKKIIPIVEGVDLLYHEATFEASLDRLALQTYHSTSVQAAQIASEAKVKKLIIGHFSSRYKEIRNLISEARGIFPETYAADDGLTFEIG